MFFVHLFIAVVLASGNPVRTSPGVGNFKRTAQGQYTIWSVEKPNFCTCKTENKHLDCEVNISGRKIEIDICEDFGRGVCHSYKNADFMIVCSRMGR